MKKDKSSFYKLIQTRFEDINTFFEKSLGHENIILTPLIDERETILESESFWCKDTPLIIPFDLVRNEFKHLCEEEKIGNSIFLQQPFKLLFDSHQQLVIRHNSFYHATRLGTVILVKKPYIGVLFDNNPLLGFICFDMFRKISDDKSSNSVFDSSCTYEKMYLDFQKYKIRKFTLNSRAQVVNSMYDSNIRKLRDLRVSISLY